MLVLNMKIIETQRNKSYRRKAGESSWKLVTQKDIKGFASATDDYHQIHVNESRQKKSL